MSEKDKTIGPSDGWAMYEACKSYNEGEITIDQLELIFLASSKHDILMPNLKDRIVKAKELYDKLRATPIFKYKSENQQ